MTLLEVEVAFVWLPFTVLKGSMCLPGLIFHLADIGLLLKK